MFLAYRIQYIKPVRLIVVYGMPDSTVFLHISHKRHEFRKKKKVFERKMRVLTFTSTFV